jgi:hypothetical protein
MPKNIVIFGDRTGKDRGPPAPGPRISYIYRMFRA